MTVRDILTQWLKDKGFDGLYSTEFECGCHLTGHDGLMPCGLSSDDVSQCAPGYAGNPPEGVDEEPGSWIWATKPQTVSEICATTGLQNCGECDKGSCGDNTRWATKEAMLDAAHDGMDTSDGEAVTVRLEAK